MLSTKVAWIFSSVVRSRRYSNFPAIVKSSVGNPTPNPSSLLSVPNPNPPASVEVQRVVRGGRIHEFVIILVGRLPVAAWLRCLVSRQCFSTVRAFFCSVMIFAQIFEVLAKTFVNSSFLLEFVPGDVWLTVPLTMYADHYTGNII
ncbi:hypothetical protein Nepgr_015408 [Nepenthes gracilis]|uniref:Uncharacterized protein n=1 Tax=Nepenthes gracilis TaxID=150966 RepID=A0AAD3SM13_NEPGR|nr:hypothetical protein Nepgr_015408 [Nepenthes gracilis]